MEAIRRYIDSELLMSIMTLPDYLKNRKVEIIVRPVDISSDKNKPDDVAAIVKSLIGVIPNDKDMTLEDYRNERLEKYETID